jgi:hypothetical protein
MKGFTRVFWQILPQIAACCVCGPQPIVIKPIRQAFYSKDTGLLFGFLGLFLENPI